MVQTGTWNGIPFTQASTHDFLFADRHRRLYDDIDVYIPRGKLNRFVELLREGSSPDDIQSALGLEYRGDVLFGTRLTYLFRNNGSHQLPEVAIPPELLSDFPKYEKQWQDAISPPPPPPERVYKPPVDPRTLRTAGDIEGEIAFFEHMADGNAPLRPVVGRVIERLRQDLAGLNPQS